MGVKDKQCQKLAAILEHFFKIELIICTFSRFFFKTTPNKDFVICSRYLSRLSATHIAAISPAVAGWLEGTGNLLRREGLIVPTFRPSSSRRPALFLLRRLCSSVVHLPLVRINSDSFVRKQQPMASCWASPFRDSRNSYVHARPG